MLQRLKISELDKDVCRMSIERHLYLETPVNLLLSYVAITFYNQYQKTITLMMFKIRTSTSHAYFSWFMIVLNKYTFYNCDSVC